MQLQDMIDRINIVVSEIENKEICELSAIDLNWLDVLKDVLNYHEELTRKYLRLERTLKHLKWGLEGLNEI